MCYSMKMLIKGFVMSLLAQRFINSKNRVLIACQPKSGSSYISRTLADITDYGYESFAQPIVYPTLDQRINNEQNLSYHRVLSILHRNVVSQTHCPATGQNISIIQKFDVKTIVLTRNIFDTCVSLRDYLDDRIYGMRPIAYVGDIYGEWDDNKKNDFIIDMIIPWYFRFFVSWWHNKDMVMWCRFEDMINNREKFFQEIINHFELPKVRDIQSEPVSTLRFNKGIMGRGQELKDFHKDKIRAKASFYPDVDFSSLGL